MKVSLRTLVLTLAIACLTLLTGSTALAVEPPVAPASYGFLMLRMMLMVGIVCALAMVTLRWGLKRFVNPSSESKALAVVARLPLEPKRSLLVVRVATRHLIIASSEAGLTNMGDLSAADVDFLTSNKTSNPMKSGVKSFHDLISRTLPSKKTSEDTQLFLSKFRKQ